jgi:hypothetical protein
MSTVNSELRRNFSKDLQKVKRLVSAVRKAEKTFKKQTERNN